MSSHGASEGGVQKSCHSPISGPEEEEEITSPRDLDNGDIWQHSSGSGGNKCVHSILICYLLMYLPIYLSVSSHSWSYSLSSDISLCTP